MDKVKNPIGERSTNQVTESINSVIDLVARVDERVQMFMKKQQTLEDKLDALTDSVNDMKVKVQVLESKDGTSLLEHFSDLKDDFHQMELKVQMIENSSDNHENRWKTIVGFVIQLIWVVVAAFVLYKLGIQAPATP